MVDYGTVVSMQAPDGVVIDDYSVWVNTGIHAIQVTDEQGTHTEYEFNQMRYSKDEYIKLLNEKNEELEQQLTDAQLALCDIYEMII